jgi:hypothetical protein
MGFINGWLIGIGRSTDLSPAVVKRIMQLSLTPLDANR